MMNIQMKIVSDTEQWHVWFAFFPVRVVSPKIRLQWLKKVYRKQFMPERGWEHEYWSYIALEDFPNSANSSQNPQIKNLKS